MPIFTRLPSILRIETRMRSSMMISSSDLRVSMSIEIPSLGLSAVSLVLLDLGPTGFHGPNPHDRCRANLSRDIALSPDRFGGPTFVATWNKTIGRKKTAAGAPFAKAALDAAWTGDPIKVAAR